MTRVGRQLRFLRQQRRLSQDEVALRTGLNQATVSNYENGKRDIPLSALLRIAGALEVSLTEVLEPLELATSLERDDPEVLVVRHSALGRALLELGRSRRATEDVDGVPAG